MVNIGSMQGVLNPLPRPRNLSFCDLSYSTTCTYVRIKEGIIMKKITAIILGLILILNSNLILFSSSKSSNITVKPYENITIKLDNKIKNTTKNLERVKVAFDEKGTVTEDGIGVKVDAKKGNELIISPPSAGWRPQSKYYIVIDKAIEFHGSSRLKSSKVYHVTVKPHEYKTVEGRIKLEGTYKATSDIDLFVNVTDFSDITVTHSAKVTIPKGKNSVRYKTSVPVNLSGYSIGYVIAPRGGNDHFYSECFIDIGYAGQKGTTNSFNDRKKFILKNDVVQDLGIYKNKEIFDKANSIIKKVIQPNMSEYEKEKALFEYVIKNMVYDYDAYHGVAVGRKSHIYEALYNNRGTCMGFSIIMKLLLNLVGIESDILEIDGSPGHVWNLVKIDGECYQLDATVPKLEFLNFTDEHANVNYFDIEKNKTLPKCTSYKYNYKFHKYWIDNNMEINKTSVLKGTVALPEGKTAPVGGTVVSVSAATGHSTEDKKDDLINTILVKIPEGSRSKDFSVTVIPNGSDYMLRAYTADAKYISVKEDISPVSRNPINMELAEPKEVKLKLQLPQGEKELEKDMDIALGTFIHSGFSFVRYIDMVYRQVVKIPKGSKELEVMLKVVPTQKPCVIAYGIVNSADFSAYEEVGFYREEEGSSVSSEIKPVNLNAIKNDITIILKKKNKISLQIEPGLRPLL